VTSRFSALRAADEIFVLDAGPGHRARPARALLRAGGLYARAGGAARRGGRH
jgi:hypothetical protein